MAEENLEQHEVDNVTEEDNVPEDLEQSELPPSEEVHEPENEPVIPEDKKWPGWPGENVFRMLVPVQKVGGIIGRKGEYIKKVCEEAKARIKILDGPPGTTERAVSILF